MTSHEERELAKLRRAVRERDVRVHELEARIEALETSTSYQIARAVAGAGKQRARGAVRLPRQLYRLWKQRSAPQNKAPKDRPSLEALDRPQDRLVIPNPFEGVIVAGVFAPATADELELHTRVVRLYPHAAAPILDAADADLVVVDGAAGDPGGPWAYLGVPGMYDRERALEGIREVARARGIPLVLWGQNPPPTLTRLDWDAVVASTQVADLLSVEG